MAGVTDGAFRLICRETGFRGLMFTEMISAKGLCYGDIKSFELARITEAEKPVAIQLFGDDPQTVAQAIELLHTYGADQIDINMGCPMPKVTKSGAGSALMLDPRRAQGIVEAAVAASFVPVSVKIRKGWDGDSVNAVDFAKRMEAAGASMITVHGRTRDQMYGGAADWGIITDVKQAVNIPVVGNGDVKCSGDAQRMIRETGCDGVMIGRAVRGNPWLIRNVEISLLNTGDDYSKPRLDAKPDQAESMRNALAGAPDQIERKRIIRRHLELSVQFKGEHFGVIEMRKHLSWYTKGVRGAAAVRNELNRLTDYEHIISCIERLEF